MTSNNQQPTSSNRQPHNWLSQWPSNLSLANCERCDWIFLLPSDVPSRCPHCGKSELVWLDAEMGKPVCTQPPELFIPFSVAPVRVKQSVVQFAKELWFAPEDLMAQKLSARLQKLYLPLWLVDTAVNAQWEAEMGFNYKAISHREQFKDDNWVTTQHKETRIRWEQRIGTLDRQYDNVRAPALEEQAAIEKQLGKVKRGEERPYQPNALTDTLICLPNRPPDDAWSDAQVAIQKIAAKECQLAATADHQRSYRWSAEYHNQHWTQLLYPIYATHYLDDDNKAKMIFIHGQTGKLVGERYVSLQKAKKLSVSIGIAAPILNIAFWLGALAFTPLVAAWILNGYYDTNFNQAFKDILP